MRSRDAQKLRRALGLIRGRPFTGCYYWWLDLATTESIRAQIVDAADVLAALEIAGRRPGRGGPGGPDRADRRRRGRAALARPDARRARRR